jgi:hypothetical protein
MKTKFLPAVITSIAFIIVLSVITFSCQKGVSNNKKLQSNDPTPESVIAQTEAAVAPYDLNVLLRGNRGLGFLKFRQSPDTARIINLDTWLFNLKRNHTYLLQRAVNLITDPTQCSSTAWLTLGLGLTPQAIHTNNWGFGHELLWRDVTSIARGTQFYIHFQIIDSLTSETVLTSDCNTYTVR